MGIDISPDYSPSVDEPYMNDSQLEYFRQKLLRWRDRLISESGETLEELREHSSREIDLLDQGSLEMDMTLKLRTRDRYRKLIRKIDAALERIKAGTYGFCEETGEEIGIRRLEARPIATLSLEAQQWHERMEKKERVRQRGSRGLGAHQSMGSPD